MPYVFLCLMSSSTLCLLNTLILLVPYVFLYLMSSLYFNSSYTLCLLIHCSFFCIISSTLFILLPFFVYLMSSTLCCWLVTRPAHRVSVGEVHCLRSENMGALVMGRPWCRGGSFCSRCSIPWCYKSCFYIECFRIWRICCRIHYVLLS